LNDLSAAVEEAVATLNHSSSAWVLPLAILASEAAKLGADAVVEAKVGHGVSKWSWTSPKAEGLAVKWSAEGKQRAGAVKGNCFPLLDPKR
jgi:uncharacterized protein YbjQ (UPF0145 family)